MWRSQPIVASTNIADIKLNIDLQAAIRFYCILYTVYKVHRPQ